MAVEGLTLVANPGSASRKYAIFDGKRHIGSLHFEHDNSRVVCTVTTGTSQRHIAIDESTAKNPARHLTDILQFNNLVHADAHIAKIGLRVVAPTGFFLQDHVMDEHVTGQLEAVRDRAPLHIDATLRELQELHEAFPETPVVGVSDSQFHATKPDVAWNYGLPLADSDRLEIKRFGYHGISVAAAVESLRQMEKLPPKLVVCHLGGGGSVTAVQHGLSVDTTMGYSPLEGLVMGTRAGSLDIAAARVLKQELHMDDTQLETYLNNQSGLLGLSGSSADIRELLVREADDDHYAGLALRTYVYNIQKAVGQMAAVLGGADMIVFAGTVGERSAPIRERVMSAFHYLDFTLDEASNQDATHVSKPACISRLTHSRPVYVIATDEAAEIARRTQTMLQH